MENFKLVTSKGQNILVGDLGTIKTYGHSINTIRKINGKIQEFKTSFKSRIISKYITKSGYHEVAIKQNGKRIKHSVHRLVGMAFVPNYSPELTINHIDGNKLNNNPDNLEWITISDNTKHEWETGLVNIRGEKHPNSKLSAKQIRYIRKALKLGLSEHFISVLVGVSNSTIHLINQNKRWVQTPLTP